MAPKYTVTAKNHVYGVEEAGVSGLPSVTAVLSVVPKPWLTSWVAKMIREELRRRLQDVDALNKETEKYILDSASAAETRRRTAADLGTGVHEELAASPTVERCLRDAGIAVEGREVPVASLQHGFGGTIDLVGTARGAYVLLDWKTGKAVYPEYAYQLGGYALAFEETYGVSPKELLVGHVAGGVVELLSVDVGMATEGFLELLGAYKTSQRHVGWKRRGFLLLS